MNITSAKISAFAAVIITLLSKYPLSVISLKQATVRSTVATDVNRSKTEVYIANCFELFLIFVKVSFI